MFHDVSPPECLAGFAEPRPVCSPWHGDSVASGGCERGASLLAAADGCGAVGRGNGRHLEVHQKRRVEMVTLTQNLLMHGLGLAGDSVHVLFLTLIFW